MTLSIVPTGQTCGAVVTGVDLTQPLAAETVAQIRAAWLQHLVIAFPGQRLSDDDLERFSQYFGPFGDDPFIAPISGREHVIAVKREADETTNIFADNWHTDWSFQERPPAGTCLYGITIPPHGGDTEFVNQIAALEAMPAELRERLQDKQATHSAVMGYSPGGILGDADREAGRSMDIRPSESAFATQLHPIIRRHPETEREAIFGTLGYIIGIEGMESEEETALLTDLYNWQTRDEFIYRHQWQADTLVMWDNRSVLHRATGGYEGHARLLHRTTIGAA